MGWDGNEQADRLQVSCLSVGMKFEKPWSPKPWAVENLPAAPPSIDQLGLKYWLRDDPDGVSLSVTPVWCLSIPVLAS